MTGITFDLDWTPVGRNREDAAAVAAQRQRRRETQQLAGHDAFRHLDIRDNFFNRLAAAGDGHGHLACNELKGGAATE